MKWVIVYLIAQWFLLSSAFGGSSSFTSQTSVVKIRSYLCKDLSRMRYGTGIFIDVKTLGHAFLVPSHALFHGKASEGVCHDAGLAKDLWIPLTLQHINAALDAAVLTADDPAATTKLIPARLAESSAEHKDFSIKLVGYAKESSLAFESRKTVLLKSSSRILLPMVPNAIEIEGMHNELGMSGGAVFSEATGECIGMLSQQYLRIVAGKEAKLEVLHESYQRDLKSEIVGLAIPAHTIAKWIDSLSTNPTDLFEDFEEQLKGRVSLTFGSLRIREEACHTDRAVIGGEGIGVGGEGEQTPVAVVIGVAPKHDCRIVLERVLPEKFRRQSWPLKESQAWFEKMGEKISYDGPRYFNELILTQKKRPVRGLYAAMVAIESGYRPLLLSEALHVPPTVASNINTRIDDAKKNLKVLAEKAKDKNAPEEAARLVEYFQTILVAIESDNAELVDLNYTKKALLVGTDGIYDKAWVYFYNECGEPSIQLMRDLLLVYESISNLKEGR